MDAQEIELRVPAGSAAVRLDNARQAGRSRGRWFQYGIPCGLEWNRYLLPVAGLPQQLDGLRIAQISDLHLRDYWCDALDELIHRVNCERPDLIVMTGDFVDDKRNHLPAVPFVRRLVGQLQARCGCFGTLGNHDRYSLGPRLEGSGVTLLDGRSTIVRADGVELELLGLPGVERKDLTRQVLDSFPPRRLGTPRLILSHFPDHIRKAGALQPDVYFAGHTHGGQICLPGGFPIIRHDSLPRRLCRGVHRAAGTWLVISRGIGFTGLPLRIFCPAEIIEVTLMRA